MIKINNYNVEINGNVKILLSEFATIVTALKDNGVKVEYLEEAFRIGLMSDEEVHKEVMKKAGEYFEEMRQKTLLKVIAETISQMPENERKKFEEMLNDNKV